MIVLCYNYFTFICMSMSHELIDCPSKWHRHVLDYSARLLILLRSSIKLCLSHVNSRITKVSSSTEFYLREYFFNIKERRKEKSEKKYLEHSKYILLIKALKQIKYVNFMKIEKLHFPKNFVGSIRQGQMKYLEAKPTQKEGCLEI